MLNTYDICDVLNDKVFNEKVNELDLYNHYLNFEKELTEYLLNKLLLFDLNTKFVTIERDIPTILLCINEKLNSDNQRKAFFYPITLYLIQYISIIFNNDYRKLLDVGNNECEKVLRTFEYVKNNFKLLDDSKTYTRYYQ